MSQDTTVGLGLLLACPNLHEVKYFILLLRSFNNILSTVSEYFSPGVTAMGMPLHATQASFRTHVIVWKVAIQKE